MKTRKINAWFIPYKGQIQFSTIRKTKKEVMEDCRILPKDKNCIIPCEIIIKEKIK